MRKRNQTVPIFFTFLFFCFFLLGISRLGMPVYFISSINNVTTFFGKNFYNLFTGFSQNSKLDDLQKQNAILIKQLKNYKVLQQENNALKDQFQSNSSKTLNLLPSIIIGAPLGTYLIDKGKQDGVKIGQAVIINDMVVGKIIRISSTISMVNLVSHPSFSTTVKDLETNALGVVKGIENGEILLDNVLLSEKLNVNETIVTKGDMDMQGAGFPPNLIIGKVVSIDRKPSALFQTAKVKSPIDFSRLSTVFIVMGIK